MLPRALLLRPTRRALAHATAAAQLDTARYEQHPRYYQLVERLAVTNLDLLKVLPRKRLALLTLITLAPTLTRCCRGRSASQG